MSTIRLTQGQIAIVDAKNYKRLAAHKWFAQWNVHTCSYYAARKSPRIAGKQYTITMHREILGLTHGDKRKGDHINHDTLNNTEKNLRISTNAQNCANRGKGRNNTSGYKGVTWNSDHAKWMGQVSAHRKSIFCGYHKTKELAHVAVQKATVKLHGEFANV
jgi:hypothetical protein